MSLGKEIERPFGNVVMESELATDATPDQLEEIKRNLPRYSPIEQVFVGSGISVTRKWITKLL